MGVEPGETGESASSGRCPTGWQGGPGRHPATARMKWEQRYEHCCNGVLLSE